MANKNKKKNKVSIGLIIKQSKLFCLQLQSCFTLLYSLNKNKHSKEGLYTHDLRAVGHITMQSLCDTHRNRSCKIYVMLIAI